MKLVKEHIVIICLALVMLALVATGVFLGINKDKTIPSSIKKQVNFIIFYPDPKATEFKIDSSTIRYDSSNKVLSLSTKSVSNTLVITEQATPDPFNDIPQYWAAFTTKLNNYTSFDSVDGTVALTRPVELKGAQSAVFKGKGTLMFIHPEHDLSDDQWRKLFNSLIIVK